MKIQTATQLLALGLLSSQFALASTGARPEARLFGAWGLEKFLIVAQDGSAAPYCDGANGTILYDKSGQMSVSINCGASPSQTSQMVFYAGSFEIHGNLVVHKITNSNQTSLIGQELTRKVEVLTDQSLVLTGAMGGAGQTIRIEWKRLDPTPELAPENEIALLTYLKLKPGTEDEFQSDLEAIIQPSRSEPGNIAWFVQQSQEDPTEYMFYTRWVNEEALDAHLSSTPLVDYIRKTSTLLAPGFPQLVRYHPVD